MKNRSAIPWLLHKIRRRIPWLLMMTAANVGSSLLGVAFALGTKNVINQAIGGTREGLLSAVTVQLAIVVGIVLTLTLSRFLYSWLEAELDRDWKRTLTARILRADYSGVSEFHSGELLNRLNNDVRTVDDGLMGILPSLAGMAAKLLAVFAVLFAMEPLFTAAMVALGGAVALSTGFARRFLRGLNKDLSASNGRVSGFLQEVFEKLLLVQAMNLEEEVEKRSESFMSERYGFQKRRRRVTLLANTCISILGYASGFAALVWCAFRLWAGAITFGELTAVIQLVGQLQSPFVNLSGILPRYIAMTASAERLMELEEACCPAEEGSVCEALPAYAFLEGIRGEGLSFSYGRDQVLQKSDFYLPKGSFSVITGPSGIGKSTLLKLLLGIFQPLEGELCLQYADGRVPLGRSTRELFAYVPQENLLFSGTLRENLLLSCPDATERQLNAAIYASCMDAFLPQLPEGLNTVLGENAHGLSEGQAQRVAIARALLGGAPILLLDEATSALDADTEEAVLKRIHRLPGRTCIAVTHRPAAVALADWQLDMEEDGIHCRRLNAKEGEPA